MREEYLTTKDDRRGVSRRDFLKGAAAGAMGVFAMGITSYAPKEALAADVSEAAWDKKADVVIVGAGGTGLAAGAEAGATGASVLILEKSKSAGGTTLFSGGVIQASGTEQQKQLTRYKDDTPEKHFKVWLKAGEGFVDEALVQSLAYGAPNHIKWLTDLGLKFSKLYGHAHIPYMDESLMADRIHTCEGGAKALVNKLLETTQSRGAKIEYETEVTQLIMYSGEIIGVEALQGGKTIRIKANKGVILAASSIDMNMEMAKDLSPQHYSDLQKKACMCVATNTGDGIRMGMEIGAAICGFGGTIDLDFKTRAGLDNTNPLFPCFYVNRAGVRFVCEDTTYAYQWRSIFQQEKIFDGPTYTIFGKSSLVSGAPWTTESVAADIEKGVVLTANTIESLAVKIGIEPANLKATFDQWNKGIAVSKADKLYGRRTGLAAIAGPYYAYKNVPGNLGAIGGLKIDTDARVINIKGEPIPRLYAGGLNAGGWIGPYYPGSGTAIMGTLHWGRKAGANVAKLNPLP